MPTSRIHYKDYGWLVQEVGEDKLKERYELLATAYGEFIAAEKLEGKVQLNGILLSYAITDYFSDIVRIKGFHGIKLVNEIKIAAYENSWLLHRKPLQLIDLKADCAFCNEQFVFLRLMALLTGGDEAKLAACNTPAMRPFLESLFYFLKFRRCEAQTLELALQAFIAGQKLNELCAGATLAR